MNRDVLFNYIASLLHAHVRYFDQELHLVHMYTARKDLNDFFADSELYSRIMLPLGKAPKMVVINNLITYVVVPVEDCFCLIGPTGACADCAIQIHIPTLDIPNELIQNVYTNTSSRLIRNCVFLYNLFAPIPMDELDCFNQNCTGGHLLDNSMRKATQLLFSHEEYGNKHNPYDAEVREMNAIEHGDIQQLRESWKEDFNGVLGMLSLDPMRSAKYLSILNIGLSARAAIRGGVPYEMAFCLSDAYCQQIDMMKEKDLTHLENVIRNIQITYTEMVAQQKTNPSATVTVPALVTRAKDYIFSHMHGRITVGDVAEALSIHPNYLNRIFKEAENATVHEYILKEKTKLARNMLAYSDHSYSDIASFLGFASQSHLGNTFKKLTGMTPKEYRDTYRKNGGM